MRVASYNIRRGRAWDGRESWWLRRRACLEVIEGLDADVLGLQEARPMQMRSLRRAFDDTALVGTGRDADGGGEHVPVLVRGRAVESSETRWLSETPDRPGSIGWDATLPRIATIVRFRDGEVPVGVVNTHLEASGSVARERGAELVAEWTRAEPQRRWIVVGDLNATANSAPLRVLASAGLRDALTGLPGGTEHAFTGALDRRRIDHVLVSDGIAVVHARIDHLRPGGRLASDHWPVVADLRLD